MAPAQRTIYHGSRQQRTKEGHGEVLQSHTREVEGIQLAAKSSD